MFTVLTYNVLAQSYIKPKRYPLCDPKDLEVNTRHARVLSTIETQNADVFCIQELEPELYKKMSDILGTYQSHYVQHQNRPDGSAIFYKGTAKTKTITTQNIQVPCVEIETTLGPIALASLHLKWAKHSTPPAQHPGRTQLIDVIDMLSTWTTAPTILAGDFNAGFDSCVLKAAQNHGFDLSCRSQRPWDTTNINGRCRKIDFLLTNANWTPSPTSLPKLTSKTPMPSAQFASDHLPLRVTFSR